MGVWFVYQICAVRVLVRTRDLVEGLGGLGPNDQEGDRQRVGWCGEEERK